jgi:putative intracellular protease/amidase
MRRYIVAVALSLAILVFGMAQQKGKVLMIVNEDQSADLELMLTKEVGVMKDLLKKAGFQVVVATASNRPMVAGSAKLKPDLKLSDVKVDSYQGLILPCMATNNAPLPPEAFAIIKEAMAKKKPVAAQTGSVLQMALAGVLAGKKYAAPQEWRVEGGTHGGDAIVQDGKIITSGICPYMAKMSGRPDGTSKLTEALIAELKK